MKNILLAVLLCIIITPLYWIGSFFGFTIPIIVAGYKATEKRLNDVAEKTVKFLKS